MHSIKSNIQSVTAFAPATCANVIVGFDVLGFALSNVGDTVTLTARQDNQIIIEAINAKENLPKDADKNTASVVIQKLCEDLNLSLGFNIQIEKGIPLSSGMGGSAASAVAALVACNAFLPEPLSLRALAQYALFGEELASGQPHADNIVPCLFGGLTLIRSHHPLEVITLPVPSIYAVVVHPHLQVATKEARKILRDVVPLQSMVQQSANLAAFTAALYAKDVDLLQRCLVDNVIEPQRAHFVPGFYKIKTAAMDAGALGFSFSGSGPSLLAFAKDASTAEIIRQVICSQLKSNNIESDHWIQTISSEGAKVTCTS